MSLVVVGSIGFDDVKTPYGSVKNAVGGSAVYASISASFFNKTSVVGVIGKDNPEKIKLIFKNKNVEIEGLEEVEGKTFYWSGEYNNLNQAETKETHLNVFEFFNPVLPNSYKNEKIVFLGNIDPNLQLKVYEQLNNPEIVAMDTMNFWIKSKKEELMKIISKVDILFINEEELKMLTKERNIFRASKKALNYGPELIIVKRGEYGAFAIKKDFLFFVPIIPIDKVVDPTGAGDTFAGAFMGYISKNKVLDNNTIKNAMAYGTVMSSINIQDFSVNCLMDCSNDEIEKRKKILRDSIIF